MIKTIFFRSGFMYLPIRMQLLTYPFSHDNSKVQAITEKESALVSKGKQVRIDCAGMKCMPASSTFHGSRRSLR